MTLGTAAAIINCDSGIFASNSKHITVREIEFEATKSGYSKQAVIGHHAIDFMHGLRCAGEDIHSKINFSMSSASNTARMAMFTAIARPDIVMDHHQLSVHAIFGPISTWEPACNAFDNNAGYPTPTKLLSVRARKILRIRRRLERTLLRTSRNGTEIADERPW